MRDHTSIDSQIAELRGIVMRHEGDIAGIKARMGLVIALNIAELGALVGLMGMVWRAS